MKRYHFFAFVSRMKYINRWGLMRNTRTENIEEHSFEVAMLAHALALISNKYFQGKYEPERACLYAMFHDANEIITGDLPTPVKYYNPEIQKSYGALEEISKQKLLTMLPEELKGEYEDILFYEKRDSLYYPIVKAADKISAYIKCAEEVKAGNREFKKAMDSVEQAIKDMKLPPADYFMKHFLPAYLLTLDELD